MDNLNVSAPRVENAKNVMNLHGLHDLKQQAREDERAALRPVAEQFEALFLQQILKESRKVSFDDGFLDGKESDTFKDWHDKQLSQDLSAQGSLGFADKIVEQLAPELGTRVVNVEQAQAILQQKREFNEYADSQQMTQNALHARPLLK